MKETAGENDRKELSGREYFATLSVMQLKTESLKTNKCGQSFNRS